MSELRWRLTDDDRDGQGALFGIDELVGPQRGTGQMSGLEFLHVTAKRILNHVPAPSRVPFRWTINVYRGCSHACVYCLAGDTPILMADGRTKLLTDVRPGDLVYGTERRGTYRHLVPTKVLAHWRTIKPAYRIVLEDGTRLIASGDHRFLTGRGWKYVVAHAAERPHLTTNNELLGVGHLAAGPKDTGSYRVGYLTGMIRGDGHLGTYQYERAGRSHGTVHRFRLALADTEPLERAERYLADLGVDTARFDFSPATPVRRAISATRNSSGAAVAPIGEIIGWPADPDEEWTRGYLAGLFDAEGSYSRGILRVSNTDALILEAFGRGLTNLGFPFVVEDHRKPNGLHTIRVTGGLVEHLRFFLMTDPAATRKRIVAGSALKNKARLRVTSIEPLGIDLPMYDITTRTGDFIADGVVSHNCFARPTHEYLGLNIGEDFDRKIVVKVNAVEKLRAELAEPGWTGEPIAMGTNTDPYQRAEGKYRLTRGVLEALAERGNPFSILTKSALVTRDLDVLTAAARRGEVRVNFSIATLDERVWRATEPGTPHPRRRIEAMRQVAAAGIRTGALIAPVLPALSDHPDQLRAVAAAIVGAGGQIIGTSALHLRSGTRAHFLDWLAVHDPALHADYLRRYATSDYAPAYYGERIRTIVEAAQQTGTLPISRPAG